MADALKVVKREKLGTANNRRLRRQGKVPAVLYGHGEANVPLAIASEQALNIIRLGHKMVTLEGDLSEGAFIKAVQWDTWGKGLVHIDLLRVSDTEMVETTVKVELKGTAPGVAEGGVIEHIMHELEIECPAAAVPEKLVVSLSDLHLDQSIDAGQVTLPAGAKLLNDPEMVVVQCVPAQREEEESPLPEPGAAEPELIRKEKAEEGEEE